MNATRIIVSSTLACGLLCSCHRENMHASHARQTRAFFSRQHVQHTAAEGSPGGLDSEEAALIKASYRRSLGASQAEPGGGAGSRVLMIEDDDHGPKKTP